MRVTVRSHLLCTLQGSGYNFVNLCNADDWTQGPTHPRQALSHWATTLALNFSVFISPFLLLDKLPLNDLLSFKMMPRAEHSLPQYSMFDLCHAEYTRKMIPFVYELHVYYWNLKSKALPFWKNTLNFWLILILPSSASFNSLTQGRS